MLHCFTVTTLRVSCHVCHSEEAQCGFKGRSSMSCFTLFTINPSMLPSVFTVQWRKGSGKGNIKHSEQYNAVRTLLTHIGISSNKCKHSMLFLYAFFVFLFLCFWHIRSCFVFLLCCSLLLSSMKTKSYILYTWFYFYWAWCFFGVFVRDAGSY